jgi:3-hydroxyacyl-[acyl-carrier-protein] dehydratase
MLLDKEKVLAFLPHRDPFLFIDSVESIIKNGDSLEESTILPFKDALEVEVNANYHAREDLDIFRGHFPGNPILPGVIQVEMMAQAASFIITVCHENPYDLDLNVAFMGISDVKFRKPVLPGMDLRINCVCKKMRGRGNSFIMSHECKIFNGDDVMSQATTLASVRF